MKIIFTKHAINYKFPKLKELGFSITEGSVTNAVKHPDQIDKISDNPKIIVSKSIDVKHILRVVYRQESDRITIITFYPSRKGRYYGQDESPLRKRG